MTGGKKGRRPMSTTENERSTPKKVRHRKVVCPRCDTTFAVKAEAAGRVVSCRDCGEKFQVPKPARQAKLSSAVWEDDDPVFVTELTLAIRIGVVVGLPLLVGLGRVVLGPWVHPDDVPITLFLCVAFGVIPASIAAYAIEYVLARKMALHGPHSAGPRSGTFEVTAIRRAEAPNHTRILLALATLRTPRGVMETWVETNHGWTRHALEPGHRYEVQGTKLWTHGDVILEVASASKIG